jgi:catechol 2,3-dioxygenase-like lactoylglutathione lyase family enzyme
MSHVAICVRDMDRTIHFYRDLVGLELVRDDLQETSGVYDHVYSGRHAQRRHVCFRTGSGPDAPAIYFQQYFGGQPVTGERIMLDQVGITHLSFTVSDLPAFAERMLAAGAEPCGPPGAFTNPDGKLADVFFLDPNGILVQFDEGLDWRTGRPRRES